MDALHAASNTLSMQHAAGAMCRFGFLLNALGNANESAIALAAAAAAEYPKIPDGRSVVALNVKCC